MSATICKATIRVMRSYDYCNFEVTVELNSPMPITMIEIDSARRESAVLVDQAVADYKEQKAQERDGQLTYKYAAEGLQERLRRASEL